MSKKKKILLILLIPLSLLFILFAYVIYDDAKDKNLFKYAAMIRAGVISEELYTRGEQLGLSSIRQFNVYRIDQEKMFGLESRSGGILLEGCSNRDYCTVKGLFIRNGLEGSDLDAILAHEYIHAMYAVNNIGYDEKLIQDLDGIYKKTPELSSVSLKNYPPEEHTYEEIFAYACTDASDKWLTEYVIGKCNSIIDRSKIIQLY